MSEEDYRKSYNSARRGWAKSQTKPKVQLPVAISLAILVTVFTWWLGDRKVGALIVGLAIGIGSAVLTYWGFWFVHYERAPAALFADQARVLEETRRESLKRTQADEIRGELSVYLLQGKNLQLKVRNVALLLKSKRTIQELLEFGPNDEKSAQLEDIEQRLGDYEAQTPGILTEPQPCVWEWGRRARDYIDSAIGIADGVWFDSDTGLSATSDSAGDDLDESTVHGEAWREAERRMMRLTQLIEQYRDAE